MFDIEIVEQAAFMYLRTVSFNGVIAIIQSWFEQVVFAKDILIDHIEQLTSLLPTNKEITIWLKPKRSGYYAIDGTWMKYRGRNFVLLIIFDVTTLDVIDWVIINEENEVNYTKLLMNCNDEISLILNGFFCDGDHGLLKSLKKLFPKTAIQLCVFHKYARCGQIISFKRIKNKYILSYFNTPPSS